jgi:hypothetical protein
MVGFTACLPAAVLYFSIFWRLIRFWFQVKKKILVLYRFAWCVPAQQNKQKLRLFNL